MKQLNSIKGFLCASESRIIAQFAQLPRAIPLDTPSGLAVYIPSLRKKSVLLVAHTDTVWTGDSILLREQKNIISSAAKQTGIGADDRAGCYALWKLRNAGASLLVVPAEETGCQGSAYVADNYNQQFKKHSFAVQLDRRGENDAVFYDCDNQSFIKYVETYGYKERIGSFSDICQLCPALKIAGVNLSIGFKKEHTQRETLNVSYMNRTIRTVRNMIEDNPKGYKYVAKKYQPLLLNKYKGYKTWLKQYQCLQCLSVFEDYAKPIHCPDCLSPIDNDIIFLGSSLV